MLSPLGKVRRSPVNIMGVGRQDLHKTFAKHLLRPVACALAEGPAQGPRRDLHPHALFRHRRYHIVALLDPGQSLWVCQYGHIPGHENGKEQLIEARWSDMVGRLDQDIAAIAQRQQVSRSDLRGEIRDDVVVGAGDEAEPDAAVIEITLEFGDRLTDLRTRVVIHPGQDVRGASHMRDALIEEGPRHRRRFLVT